MHYWIDGYNFFFRLAKNYHTMKKREKKLLEELYQAMIFIRSPVTVVFDGREEKPAEPLRRNLLSMNIVYTPIHQTADDYILEMLDHAKNPAHEMVVSSDRELLRRSAQRGASTQTVEAFIRTISRKKHPTHSTAEERKQMKESSFQFERLLQIFEKRLSTKEQSENERSPLWESDEFPPVD